VELFRHTESLLLYGPQKRNLIRFFNCITDVNSDFPGECLSGNAVELEECAVTETLIRLSKNHESHVIMI